MDSALHHLHKRKRIHQKHEKYPNPDKLKNLFDKLIYAAAIVGPLVTLPQILKIWMDKSIEGLSIYTWLGFMAISSLWLVYGILHKEKPIIVSSILYFSAYIIIVAGIIIHS